MKTSKLWSIKTMLFMILCTIVAFSSCSKDGDDSSSKGVWYASQAAINNIKLSQTAFAEIEKAIDNHELLEKTYVSNGNYLNRYAERSTFVGSGGKFTTSGNAGRLKGTIECSLSAIRMVDSITLTTCYYGLFVDEDVTDKSLEKITTLFRGHIFKSVSVYKTSEFYYTYVKLGNRIILSDGTIYIETDQGLIKDGTSDLMVKMNPYKIFVVSNDKDNNEKDDNNNKEEPSKEGDVYKESGKQNGHGYVDLGLSVKWASMNVGATTPEGYGDYFAWGETQPKNNYEWSTYFDSVYGNSSSFRKYVANKKTVLDLEDDAAHVNWGGNWRMPTKEEMEELINNCTWFWTIQNGVNGYKVTSKKNGKSIFLSAAGYCGGIYFWNRGSMGVYWSSSLRSVGSSYDAYAIYFLSTYVESSDDNRRHGLSVRAVCP